MKNVSFEYVDNIEAAGRAIPDPEKKVAEIAGLMIEGLKTGLLAIYDFSDEISSACDDPDPELGCTTVGAN